MTFLQSFKHYFSRKWNKKKFKTKCRHKRNISNDNISQEVFKQDF